VLLNDFVELGADQSQLMELCLLSHHLVHHTFIKLLAVELQTGKHLVPHLRGKL